MKSISLKILVIIALVCTATFANTLKIVYNHSTPPLKFTDIKNTPNGMLIDIWKFWAKKNNIKIKFIEASWSDTLEMIKDGRADIHAGIYYTKERDVFLDYSGQALYENKSYFFYNKDVIDIKTKKDLKPFVVGTGNGYPNSFMQENYSDIYTKKYPSAFALKNAFIEGEVNIILSSMAGMTYFIQKNNYDMKKYRFSDKTHTYTKKYYGAVKQGNTKVLSLINEGFDNISRKELEKIENKWTVSLNENYLKDYHYKHISLSKKHRDYLMKKQEIKMCVDPSWFPFEAIEKGKHVGIIADIFKELQRDLPIPIKLITTNTWSESLTFVKGKQCDILAGAAQTQNRNKYLNFTKEYLTFPEVIATRESEPFIDHFEDVIDKKIGIVKSSAVIEFIRSSYPTINLIEVSSVSDGLMQVSQGKLYGFLNTSAAISYYISKEGMTNLKIASKVDVDYHLRTAVRKDDLVLLDIFNTIIHNLDQNKINDIKEHWLKVKVQEIIDYDIIYKTIGFFILIILFILYWNRKLNNEIVEKEKLQKELDTLSQVIEQSMVSVIITNLKGEIEYVNPFCISQTGYSKEELLSKNPNMLKSGYHDASFYKKLWQTIKNGKTWQGEFSNKNKEGHIFWESAIIAPIFDKEKQIKYYASIKENITEKVLAREKLQEAQEDAINANGAKSEFLAKMSHEIRTPMNAVLGMLYLLEKTQITSLQENYIKKANHSANSLLGIINDILDFSKIEAGKLDINNQEFEFNTMITDILSVMSFKAEEKNLELLAYYDNSIPFYIISDKLRVGQVLSNLISNAVKFTSMGEVMISTKLIKENNNHIEIMFCIKDSGIGISSSSQKVLFQEFSQVDSSATRNFEGTGLGLAICKKLTELLGGKIWIEESKEGVGSTFCFTIKCTKSSTKSVKTPLYDKTQVNNLKCLVVDDNNSAAEVLTKMLESFGYEVKTVLCGKDAIKYIKNEIFDFVFLDYKMDELNGVETYQIVKDDLKANKTKTIMISAYSREIIDANLQAIGIEGYLSKPISPSSLYNKIFEVQNNEKEGLPYVVQNITIQYFNGAKILLVEDNELNQEFALHMLEERGLEVDVASDGIESLAKIKNKKYDLILMDIQMPHMDGLEATRHIRKMNGEYFQNIPIIALSANALLGDKEKSLDAGMNEHITKPFDPIALFNILSIYLDTEEKSVETINIHDQNNIKLQRLDGDIFDIENTLSKLNNSYEVYIKILKQFSHTYEDVFNTVYSLIESRDVEALQAKVHEIKGVTGNIGAMKLFDRLIVMDRFLKKGEIPNLQLLNEFKNELSKVITSINKLETEEITSKSFDKEEVIVLLQNLENNLEEDVVACDEILQKLVPYLESEYKEFSEHLSLAIDDFDTDTAKELITKFVKDIK